MDIVLWKWWRYRLGRIVLAIFLSCSLLFLIPPSDPLLPLPSSSPLFLTPYFLCSLSCPPPSHPLSFFLFLVPLLLAPPPRFQHSVRVCEGVYMQVSRGWERGLNEGWERGNNTQWLRGIEAITISILHRFDINFMLGLRTECTLNLSYDMYTMIFDRSIYRTKIANPCTRLSIESACINKRI